MNDMQIVACLHGIMKRQEILIEQLSSLSKVIANHLDLPIEEGVDEYETE